MYGIFRPVLENVQYDCVIGLGANLGDRAATLGAAVQALIHLGTFVAVSSVYETDPVGPPQPSFLNAAVRLRVALPPESLLVELLRIESAAGRERRERWGPRTLDLDILWIQGVVCQSPALTVPHPELCSRAFALVPLLDVAPEAADPTTGSAYRSVLAGLETASVRRAAVSLDFGSDPSRNAP
jgi:2-amino-4-hydroxy-6-hydroxymethyldihydropteridine diphosphokinase